MSRFLMITADRVGEASGGGSVTRQEYEALCQTARVLGGGTQCWMGGPVPPEGELPWAYDAFAQQCVERAWPLPPETAPLPGAGVLLAHFYAGTFSRTVRALKRRGCKVSYTAAAHDVAASAREHHALGLPYNYPHLTEPALLQDYLQGYLEADLLICPSRHSAAVMRGFGARGPIEVIPHGTELPETVTALPDATGSDGYTVGYLGAVGPDKGLRYLLEAWRLLDVPEEGPGRCTLLLAGRDSVSPFVTALIRHVFQGSLPATIRQLGWQDSVSAFYERCCLYVQPSVTEGFGIEVLEAMAHGRPVIASSGAGASELLPGGLVVPPGDPARLADAIRHLRGNPTRAANLAAVLRAESASYTWAHIRATYVHAWMRLVLGKQANGSMADWTLPALS